MASGPSLFLSNDFLVIFTYIVTLVKPQKNDSEKTVVADCTVARIVYDRIGTDSTKINRPGHKIRTYVLSEILTSMYSML